MSQHIRGNSIDASEAPLFYSAADNFVDEDDHNRESNALRASRRNFGAYFGLGVHEEGDGEERDNDLFESEEEQRKRDVTGLAASWKPAAPFRLNRRLERDVIAELEESDLGESAESDRTTRPLRSGEIREESVMEGDGHYFLNPEESQMSTDLPPDDVHVEVPLDDDDDDNSESSRTSDRLREAPPAPIYQSEMPEQSFHSYPPRQPLPEDSLPRPVSAPSLSAPSHDSTWAAFYGLAMAGMFATAFMTWLGTEAPTDGLPLGDTIYSTLHSAYRCSYRMLSSPSE